MVNQLRAWTVWKAAFAATLAASLVSTRLLPRSEFVRRYGCMQKCDRDSWNRFASLAVIRGSIPHFVLEGNTEGALMVNQLRAWTVWKAAFAATLAASLVSTRLLPRSEFVRRYGCMQKCDRDSWNRFASLAVI